MSLGSPIYSYGLATHVFRYVMVGDKTRHLAMRLFPRSAAIAPLNSMIRQPGSPWGKPWESVKGRSEVDWPPKNPPYDADDRLPNSADAPAAVGLHKWVVLLLT